MSTKIEWCDKTINPVIGCSKISAGCQNCYAERMAARLARMGADGYSEVVRFSGDDGSYLPLWNGDTEFVESALEKPLKWKKPRKIFVCSMGDLFYSSVDFHWIEKIWDVFFDCPQHTFMVLTKRPARMHDFAMWMRISRGRSIDYPNVWIGVTAENQQAADERIPILLQIPAAVRFVSVEPMLEKIDLRCCHGCGFPYTIGHDCELAGMNPEKYLKTVDWVIAGCESGPKRRPSNIDWFRCLRDQCHDADVPFFLKQMEIDGKLVKMPELDGKVWAEFPNKEMQ